jgi:DNA-binding CsgD family transcriptional regulator
VAHRLDPCLDPWLDLVRDSLLGHDAFPGDLIRQRLHETFGVHVMGAWSGAGDSVGRDTAIPTWPTAEIEPYWLNGGYRRHPSSRWYAVSPDLAPTTIARVPTAVVPVNERHRVQEALIPAEVRQQLTIMYHRSTGRKRLFILGKAGRDFTSGDLTLAAQIQPLLGLLDRHWEVLQASSPAEAGEVLGLSGRQLAVLELLEQGLTAAAIGHRLGISTRTVEAHLRRVYRKLGVNDRLLAVRAYRDVRQRLGGAAVSSPT